MGRRSRKKRRRRRRRKFFKGAASVLTGGRSDKVIDSINQVRSLIGGGKKKGGFRALPVSPGAPGQSPNLVGGGGRPLVVGSGSPSQFGFAQALTSGLPVPSFAQLAANPVVFDAFFQFVTLVAPKVGDMVLSLPWGQWASEVKQLFQDWWRDEQSGIGGAIDAPNIQDIESFGIPTGAVVEPTLNVTRSAPPGYVMVTFAGQRVAMLEPLAKRLKLAPKRRAKAPISGRQWKNLKESARVVKIVENMDKEVDKIAKLNARFVKKTTRRAS